MAGAGPPPPCGQREARPQGPDPAPSPPRPGLGPAYPAGAVGTLLPEGKPRPHQNVSPRGQQPKGRAAETMRA